MIKGIDRRALNSVRDNSVSFSRRRLWLLAVAGVALMIFITGMTFILAKAVVGQWLLQNAWEQAVEVGAPQRPWPWADFLVAAELRIPELGIRAYVLNIDSGEALAFGPGFSRTNPHDEVKVISGHRDTHFLFIRDLKLGMRIELHSLGRSAPEAFAVQHQTVVDSRRAQLPPVAPNSLILLTCFPLDTMSTNGPMRYLSIAHPQTLKVSDGVML